MTWTIGGSPIDYHNAVVRANLDPAEADHTIAESLQRMQARGVPGTWHVGPSMQPADIGTRLQAHGFCSGGDEIGMAVALNDIPRRVAAPASFRVVPVRTQRDLERWVAVLGSGFGEGEREAEWVGAMYVCIGLGDEVPWRHYLGLLDDVPVATASLFLHEGSAGIYFVYTVPAARRQGSRRRSRSRRCTRGAGPCQGILLGTKEVYVKGAEQGNAVDAFGPEPVRVSDALWPRRN